MVCDASYIKIVDDFFYKIQVTLQENGSFPRVNTLGNTQRSSEKLIFKWGIPSIVVVLSLIGNIEFPMSRQRKKLFPSALPSEIELNALRKKR